MASIVAWLSRKPSKQGPDWASFKYLEMFGAVHSGLLGETPVNIACRESGIIQTLGTSEDVFDAHFNVKVVGIALEVIAYVSLPAGTLSSDRSRCAERDTGGHYRGQIDA
jgi:hypothetical protein